MRDSFVFYSSFAKAIKALDAENAKDLMTAIFDYALEDKKPEFNNPIIEAMFELIKPQLEANKKRYENAKKGGRPKKTNENQNDENKNQTKTKLKPNKNQNETKTKPNLENPKPNVNVNVNVNDNDNVNENVNVNEEEYKKAASNFFESYFQQISNFNKDLSSFRGEYESILMNLASKYSLKTVKETLSAALNDDFWASKLLEPTSVKRNFAKMKFELVDKRKKKKNNLSELQRAVKMFENMNKEAV